MAEEVEEKKWYTFEGNEDCSYYQCRGWDGQSKRCDCGNRRVEWNCTCDFECGNPEICENRYATRW